MGGVNIGTMIANSSGPIVIGSDAASSGNERET
jgi:hypothetical protein